MGRLTGRLHREGPSRLRCRRNLAEVWGVVTDVTRVGEWSHECHTAAWLPGHHSAEVGAQFAGRNRNGAVRWGRRCTVIGVEPERVFAYRTDGGLPPDSTEWRFEPSRPTGWLA